ncbi:scavenger receptor cysteine-rich type 1 protein M160 [Eleginops maclovinus]|uniref:scavenger receptor cysteine-rich type 1 protein M160 n=1 Tax=Eleginops maclovinus TaxID=56733 RepID=UPI0030806075
MMLLLLFLLLLCSAEPAITKDYQLFLINGSNPCEGYIRIYHKGKLGYMGDSCWNETTEEVVCKSIRCGKAVQSIKEPTLFPPYPVWLNDVECKGGEDHLGECTYPGFGISEFNKGTLRKIECSNKINISLDGYKCAGAVKYSTDAGQTYSGYFCDDSAWDKTAADILCKSLNCGKTKEIPRKPWMPSTGFKQSKKISVKCSDIEDLTDLWQCETKELRSCQTPATVICSGHEILQLSGDSSNVCSGWLEQKEKDAWIPVKNNNNSPDERCKQMHCGTSSSHRQATDSKGIHLTCKDDVKVVLWDNGKPSHCYGTVYIERNNSNLPVCASSWTNNETEAVCKELGCGNVITYNIRKSSGEGIMDNVECSGKESSLWHCRAQHDPAPVCFSNAYVVCSGSMEVILKDTPGKCAGRLEIKYEGKWQRVDKKGWKDINSDVVCRVLNCSEKSVKQDADDFQKFSQGSSEFLASTLNCDTNDKHISNCMKVTSSNPGLPSLNLKTNVKEAVGITCQGHERIFLDGNSSCSGKVGIKTIGQTYWLSGSLKTWNREMAITVCRDMHCGEPMRWNTTMPNQEEKVWNESYSCSAKDKSLFHCGKINKPNDHTAKIATVQCTGKKNISLSKGCWGYVHVCSNGKCGGICANPWTDKDSQMLCKNLNCGDHVLQPITKIKESVEVTFQSFHSTEKINNLDHCSLMSFDDNDRTCNNNPAYVVCSGSVKAKFDSSREKCSGNLTVQYEDQWLPVCEEAIKDIKTRNTICRELNCGLAADEIKYNGPKNAKPHVISQIQCSKDDFKDLTHCSITSGNRPCTPAALKCSKWSQFALPGATTCSGYLFVDSEGKRSAVSTQGWTETEGERLCNDLQCGKLKLNETRTSIVSPTTSFSCAGVENPESIWDCLKETSPLVPGNATQQLFIECQADPKVELSSNCFGEVKINDIEVCSTNWEDSYSRLTCQEKDCRNAIGFSVVTTPKTGKRYNYLTCEENHYRIGQCKRVMETCDDNLVSVFCTKNVEFKTTEKCGGQIQVKYRSNWEKVCPLKSFPRKLMEILCQKLECAGYNSSIQGTIKATGENLATTLNCTENHMDPKYCVEIKSCTNENPAEIYCNGYTDKTKETETTSTPTVAIILGVVLLLVLVIVIVVIVRICIVNKDKNISSRMLRKKMSINEVEIESGDYYNVPDRPNEMEDLGAASFRSERSFHSNNELSDAAETQLLTLQTNTAAAGEKSIPDVPMDTVSDGGNIEEEDPQEDYDDIEAFPEITQTEADVHESDTEEPLLVEGDDNYLVPGQDG